MQWEVVIGLENHVQLTTQSKIFSGSSIRFGAEPNTQASPVDLALPGVLPVLNRGAVERAIRFGLAVGAKIAPQSVFARKNYFYPDLPKGYQISQFEDPVVQGGTIRALAVTSPKRWPSLPDTPTFTELGLDKFQVLNVCGLVGPAGLDPRIVEKLHGATVKALATPAVREAFTKLGVEIDGSDPQTFAAFIKKDLERWARVIVEGKVKAR